ncbi:hypothetical protein GDO78_023239 [Eleutherodactylus coqui]|uniref:Uncharacterized protein n=1 Tax=Eleutherodactylus coqui TaxID=57060 RepID=A0A8J6EC39_ELECQ|nr:hypothetical protein GDO78_023239 [Eleutherodactylus coqui]
MQMKNLPLSQMFPQPFTAKIHHLILLYRAHLLIHHRLRSRRKVTEGKNIRELIQGKSHIHVQNVGNVLLRIEILLNIRELTQERSRIHVQNVRNAF